MTAGTAGDQGMDIDIAGHPHKLERQARDSPYLPMGWDAMTIEQLLARLDDEIFTFRQTVRQRRIGQVSRLELRAQIQRIEHVLGDIDRRADADLNKDR